MARAQHLIPLETIERRIYVIRDHKVMLDRDLAKLYGVKAIALRQQVKRNAERFPKDFLFQLHDEEVDALVSQHVIPSRSVLGGALPYVFTQEGVAMLSSVLRSTQAVQVNIAIMRAFVRMREVMISHKEMARRIDDMEGKYDAQFKAVFDALRRLMEPSASPKKRPIGYIIQEEDA
jgi:ORF6N domain